MKKYLVALVAAAALVVAIPSAAMADTYNTGFEDAPFTGSAFPGTDVNGQNGWQMTPSMGPSTTKAS